MSGAKEFLQQQADGTWSDAEIQDDILDNADADDETAEEAVKRAIDEDGMSVDEALELYATDAVAKRWRAKKG